jgi:hypothetical protein
LVAKRRCIVPVDGFFEWRAIKGARAKQPYAIAMKDGSPFGLAGLWENWKNPKTGDWERTFAIDGPGLHSFLGGDYGSFNLAEGLGFRPVDTFVGEQLDDGAELVTGSELERALALLITQRRSLDAELAAFPSYEAQHGARA